MKINVKKYLFVFFTFSLFHLFSVISIAQDVPYNLYTPRNSQVLNTYDTQEMSESEIAYWNNYVRTNYRNATPVQPSTREYNCHGYAWSVSEGGPQVWIGYDPPAGAEEVYWSDGSYDQLSEALATKVSYSGDHSAITSGTPNYYYSKWNKYPLMYHHKDYTPGYGTANQFFRRSVDVPQDQSSIQSAISAAVYGQTINVSNPQTLQSDLIVPSGVVLSFISGANININGYSITTIYGNININGGSFNGLAAIRKQSGAIKGIYSSYQTAWSALNNNESLELASGTFNESPSFSSRSNIAFTGQGSSSTIINGSITVSSSSNIDISGLRVTGTVSASNSQYIYVSSCNIPSATMLYNYYSTGTNLGNSTSGTDEQASYAVTSYGGTGNIYSNTIRRFDAGVYLASGASFNVGTGNTFCNNGIDIYAPSPAYAYAISNNYSYALPNSVYGNVFTTGSNGVCSLPKVSALQQTAVTSSDSKLLKDADDKYLALLRKIYDDSKKEKYDKNKYETDYNKLINDYKNVAAVEKDKQIVKAALTKLSYLYKGKEEKDAFTEYLTDLASKNNFQQYLPYIQRFSIWDNVEKSNYENSISVAEAVIKGANSDVDLICEMLYEKGLIYKYYIKNQTRAEEMFGDVIANYPKHILAKFASQESGIELKEQFGIKTTESAESVSYSLDNYPNPFNPTTTISYSLPQAGHVILKVYDLLGREAAELVNGVKEKGKHTVTFNASKLSSGFYIYTIKVNDFNASKKMLLTK